MKAYTDMTKKELLECIELVDPDTHEHAKRTRWTKPALIEWLEGFAEQTDEPPIVAEEPEPAETTQTDNDDNKQEESINGKKISIEIDGKTVERKVTTYARSGRSWIRHGKGTYFEVIQQDNGSYVGIPWQD
jgi:hypothetical protein